MPHDAVALRDLIDRNMRTLDRRSARMVSGRKLNEWLDLTAATIAIRREERRSVNRSIAPGDKGITHHRRNPLPVGI